MTRHISTSSLSYIRFIVRRGHDYVGRWADPGFLGDGGGRVLNGKRDVALVRVGNPSGHAVEEYAGSFDVGPDLVGARVWGGVLPEEAEMAACSAFRVIMVIAQV